MSLVLPNVGDFGSLVTLELFKISGGTTMKSFLGLSTRRCFHPRICSLFHLQAVFPSPGVCTHGEGSAGEVLVKDFKIIENSGSEKERLGEPWGMSGLVSARPCESAPVKSVCDK